MRLNWRSGLTGISLAVAALTGLAGNGATAQPAASAPSDPITASEQALFLSRHLATLHPPATLRYGLKKAGSLEAGFDDEIKLDLVAQPDRSCCSATAAFVRMPQRQPVLQVDAADGNPVIQFFLDHDIAEMRRLTGGSQSYFRKLIRLSLASNAVLKPATLRYRGKDVAGQQIDISPYLDDPNRGRYPKLIGKRYQFLLSTDVPGGVVAIRSRVDGEKTGLPALLSEDMILEGAGPLPDWRPAPPPGATATVTQATPPTKTDTPR